MTPKNRTELIELMARAVNGACYPPHATFDPVFIEVTPEAISRSILTSLESSGVALVPVEATEYMALCGEDAIDDAFTSCTSPPDTWEDEASNCYKAMLTAAPYRSDK